MLRVVIGAAAWTLSMTPAFAQNTGGVFGPVVNEGHKAAQYRITFDPDSDNWAQRLHYEQSLNGDVMVRGIVQTRETPSSELDFDFLQGELFWELATNSDAWKTGLRFDARYRNDDRPEIFNINWMNQFQLAPNLSARALLLTNVEVGDQARDGVFLQSRFNLTHRFPSRASVGVEVFNSYGSTDKFRKLREQSHQIGPFATVPLADEWDIFVGALFGVTQATPDTNLRLWVTRVF